MPSFLPIGHPWIDESRAPIYGINFPSEATDEEVIALGRARERWAAVANYRVAWIVDLASVVRATATQRRLFSEHLERFEPHDVAFNQGSALIAPGAVLRGVVTAVFWLKPPRFPTECFSTYEEGLAWARERLARGTSGARPLSTGSSGTTRPSSRPSTARPSTKR